MSLQPYKDSTSGRELELIQALVTPEEAEKRQREVWVINLSYRYPLLTGYSRIMEWVLLVQADELDVKLRRIIEEVPDSTYNRMGSNAGANSKTFDQYRFAKQRELERVRKMEEEAAAAEKKRRFQVRCEIYFYTSIHDCPSWIFNIVLQ